MDVDSKKIRRFEQFIAEAHRAAILHGEQTPAERPEFSHLPMRRADDGTPVFHTQRLRADQREDILDFYSRKRPSKNGTCYQVVREYVEAFGQRGLRLNDLAEELRRDRKDVRTALRKLETQGVVEVREEPNPRGNGATARKRYFLRGGALYRNSKAYYQTTEGWIQGVRSEEITDQPLYEVSDMETNADIDRHYHGSAAQSASCKCALCKQAYQSWWEDTAASYERQQGGTGFIASLETKWYGPDYGLPYVPSLPPVKGVR